MILTEQNKRWLMVFGYILFIYATLGVVGIPLRFLRAHGVLRLCLAIGYLICLGISLRYLLQSQSREIWRFVLVFLAFTMALFIAQKAVKIPEEKIHFFEYGLVGILFARALEPKIGPRWKTLLLSLVCAGLTGWLDEILQGYIPGRHYDVHDIFLNVVSGFLGLLLYSAFPSENRTLNSSIQQKSAFRN